MNQMFAYIDIVISFYLQSKINIQKVNKANSKSLLNTEDEQMTVKPMFRTFQTMQPCNITVIFVAAGLIICFGLYIFEFMLMFNPVWRWYVIPFETILFILMYWTFLKVYLTEPGTVPQFFAVDSSSMSKKQPRVYCLLCHNFKAQRTHHCSTCGKCILNMDHHCPWINNCVGFYNRKFFILFLFYLSVNILCVLPQQVYFIVIELIAIIRHQQNTTVHTVVRILVSVFQFGILLPVSTFMGYHMTLVFKNETTLMEMKRERDEERGKQPEVNVYNIGCYRNFLQVFGKRCWEWPLPIAGTLTCDGLNWPKNTVN